MKPRAELDQNQTYYLMFINAGRIATLDNAST
jgi:hypothetical protein